MTISALPTIPSRNQDPATFVANADAFLAALPTFRTEANALAVTVDANTTSSTTNANIATTKAVEAAASATAAISAANAAVWISGTTYTQYTCVISPITYFTYRRTIAGAGTTDPSLDGTNWALVITGLGIGGAAITGNVTLTSSSGGAMTVTPSTHGLYMTLPVGTTCTKGITLFSVYNAGDYDYGIKNSAGTQLGWVRPRTGTVIGLSDNSTAAGIWATYGLEKLGVTAAVANSAATDTSTGKLQRIALDANRTCFVFSGTSAYAIVYDQSTLSWGSAALIRTGISSGNALAVLAATDKILVVSNSSTTAMEAVILSISGTAITVESGTKGTATLAGNISDYGQLIAVGSSFVVSYSRSASHSGIRAISVSGVTPTIGAESALSTAVAGVVSLFALGSVVRAVYPDTSLMVCKPFTVSGSTLSAGTLAQTAATTTGYKAFLNTSGNIVVLHSDTSLSAAIFKLTSTTEAVSVAVVSASTGFGTLIDYINVSATKTVILNSFTGGVWYANILTDTSGTASCGTAITGTFASSISHLAAITSSGNNARFAIGSASLLSQFTLDCSGASASLSNANYVASTTTGIGTPQYRSQFDVRNGRNLLAGSTLYALLGNGTGAYDGIYAVNGMAKAPALSLLSNLGSTDSVGGTNNNESWIFGITQSSTGFAITRVEAAE